MLAGSEVCFGGSLGSLPLPIAVGLPVSNPRRMANECDLTKQSHKKLFWVAEKKKSDSWISLSSSHSPISDISSKCVQQSNEQLSVILGSDI